MPAVPAGLDEYYSQELSWQSCSGTFECATISAPLNYDDPSGKKITLALLKRPARGKAIGTLFVNPGGPGGSGIDMAKSASYYFPTQVLENFDIVGFDPRGVGQSTAVDCVDDATLGRILDISYNRTDPGWEQKAEADQVTIATGCEAHSGDLLPYVGTISAARDLDIMRHLVGDPQLYYVGFSYGTSLGGQYADLFPKNVGRLILDGAVDTSLTSAKLSTDQTLGFEVAIRRYIEDCLGGLACPFSGSTEDVLSQIHALLEEALSSPFPTNNASRPLTQSLFFSGIIMPLYSSSTWPMLTQAFTALLEKNDASLFLKYADIVSEREEDGSFSSNSTVANWAINCADYPPADPQEVARASERLRVEAPVFGDLMTEGPDMCASWPYQSQHSPGVYKAEGSAPIVVVGTKYDPATPYAWAQAMNAGFENSVLVTWEGDGHTAYSHANSCIKEPLTRYLLTGEVPEDGLTCTP